jgi:hypothetical protein
MFTYWTRSITRLALAAVLLAPTTGAAQGVGAGPLTETLLDTDPTVGVIAWGRIKFAPGLTIDELGFDSNVFDQHDEPSEDYVIRGRPDVSMFSLLRFAKISAYAGSDMQYYRTYDSERSIGHQYRARVDFLLSRVQPYIGGGQTRNRTRPNGEIDVRADQQKTELGAGIAFSLGPNQAVFAGVTRFQDEFKDGVEEGVDLSTTLNHYSDTYKGGLRTDLTPITTLTLEAEFTKDIFELAPLRDMDNKIVTASLRIGAAAMVTGAVSVSYHDTSPTDPLVEQFRGITGEAALGYAIMEFGRINLTFNRSLEYSFDEAEALYLENSLSLSYTHRLFGQVDVQARAARSLFDYSYREGVPPHQDRLDTAAGSLGYNLANRTRIAVNYEVTERKSPAFVERNYDRVRIYLSWLYAF